MYGNPATRPYIRPDYVYHESDAEVGPAAAAAHTVLPRCHAVMSSLATHRTIKRTSMAQELFRGERSGRWVWRGYTWLHMGAGEEFQTGIPIIGNVCAGLSHLILSRSDWHWKTICTWSGWWAGWPAGSTLAQGGREGGRPAAGRRLNSGWPLGSWLIVSALSPYFLSCCCP